MVNEELESNGPGIGMEASSKERGSFSIKGEGLETPENAGIEGGAGLEGPAMDLDSARKGEGFGVQNSLELTFDNLEYTSILLEKGTSCLKNFDSTQLQVFVIEIRSSLPSRSPEIIGELNHRSAFEVVLSSNAATAQHTLRAPNQADSLAELLSATSSRRAICVDSESPPSSPRAQPHLNPHVCKIRPSLVST